MTKDYHPMTIEGIEVVDARSDFPLYITEEHATNGIPMDKEKCPGAISCVDGMPGTIRSQVYKSRLYALKEMFIDEVNAKELRWERYTVPESLTRQEAVIDNGGRFQPGMYLLKAPNKSQRTGPGKTQGTRTRPPKDPNAPKIEPHKTPMRENAPTRST